jgi:hypothetical protein
MGHADGSRPLIRRRNTLAIGMLPRSILETTGDIAFVPIRDHRHSSGQRLRSGKPPTQRRHASDARNDRRHANA